MIWFFFLFFFVALGAGAHALGRVSRQRSLAVLGPVIALALLAAITAFRSLHQVDAGHVGLVYEFGDIVGQRGEGLSVTAPWQSMRTESIQVQQAKFSDLATFSSETQDVFITATLNYSVSPGAVQSLYRDVGPDWFHRLVEPRVQNFFKEETVRFKTVDVAPNREQLRSAVRTRLAADLEPYSIDVTDLLVDNIDFRPEFKQAIESKQIATQDALREEERIREATAQAAQGVAEAEGKAAETVIAAEAAATANDLINASLTPQVLQYEAIQRFADDIEIALIPAGEGVILDPTSLLAPSPTAAGDN